MGASFHLANLAESDFTGADLTDVSFREANLEGAMGIDLSQIPKEALCGAILPDGSMAEECDYPY